MKIDIPIEQMDHVIHSGLSNEVKLGIFNALKSEKSRIELELAKITLMLHALETGDFSNLSEKLISEMMNIREPEILLLKERNN